MQFFGGNTYSQRGASKANENEWSKKKRNPLNIFIFALMLFIVVYDTFQVNIVALAWIHIFAVCVFFCPNESAFSQASERDSEWERVHFMAIGCVINILVNTCHAMNFLYNTLFIMVKIGYRMTHHHDDMCAASEFFFCVCVYTRACYIVPHTTPIS